MSRFVKSFRDPDDAYIVTVDWDGASDLVLVSYRFLQRGRDLVGRGTVDAHLRVLKKYNQPLRQIIHPAAAQDLTHSIIAAMFEIQSAQTTKG